MNSKIKKIRGTYSGNAFSQIIFQDKYGTEISRIGNFEQQFGPDQMLADDEEIIGVYGDKDYAEKYSEFYSIGFIVWKRPKN